MFDGRILEFLKFAFLLNRYHNKEIAVKIIQPGETVKEIAKRESRFAREIALLQKVQHKNLVKVSIFCVRFSTSQYDY